MKLTCPRQPASPARGIALALLATTSLSIATLSAAPAYAQEAASYDIPAGPLPTVLNQFARQAHVELIYDAPLTQSATSPGLKGSFGAAEGLSRILAGTGLTYRQTGPNVFTLERAPTADAGTVQLGPVRVSADNQANATPFPTPKTDRAATDRSHSYAARAATVAGKTPQELKEIPQSVSVLTRQRMDDQNIVSLEDALRQTTGVTAITYNAVTSYFQVRGYPSEIQLDGIPGESASIQYAPQFDMAMYDRIEVLRGPSGLLQGQGSPAGTVNLVRKRPHDTFGWVASAMGGSWNNFHGDLDVTGPLDKAGDLRGRVVAAGEDRDYFTDKQHEKHYLLYGILEYDLTPTTVVTLSGAYENQRAAPFDFGQSVYSNGDFLNAARSTFFGLDWSHLSWRTRETYASVNQDLGGGWTAKASANYRWGHQNYVYGYIVGPVNLNNSSNYRIQGNVYDTKALGADAYVSGPVTLFNRTHELLIGANYSWRQSTGGSGGANTSVSDIYDIEIPEQDVPITSRSDSHTETYGLYGQARINLADPLTLVLGGRVTNYRAKTRSGLTIYSAYKHTGDINGHFTPSAGLVFDVTKHLTLYGSYAGIFSSQSNMTSGGELLRPRTGKQYEIGAKAALFDNALNISGALFNVEDTGRAVSDPTNPTYYVAAGKVRSRGAEAEISGEPLPGWNLFAGYTYLETKYLKDPANEGIAFDLEEPRHTLKLWNTYRFGDADRAGFQIGGGVRIMSKTSRGGPVQGAYAVVDAQVGYRLNEQWSATLSINNLFDKSYYTRVPSSYFGFYGAPRNFAVTLRKGF